MILFEFLLEVVLQFFLEALVEGGFEGLGKVLGSRVGRLVASAVTGLVGGVAWGAWLKADGLTTTPKTVWGSLLIAAVAMFVGIARTPPVGPVDDGVHVLPWHWTPHQWQALALLNVAVAIGVAIGFGGGAA